MFRVPANGMCAAVLLLIAGSAGAATMTANAGNDRAAAPCGRDNQPCAAQSHGQAGTGPSVSGPSVSAPVPSASRESDASGLPAAPRWQPGDQVRQMPDLKRSDQP